MDDAVRLLKVATRELGAQSVRIELADTPREDTAEIACWLQGMWRLVARFAEAPANRDAKAKALQAFADSFHDALEQAADEAPKPSVSAGRNKIRELADMLEILRERLGAQVVLIIDEQSPVVWAAVPSLPWLDDVNALLETVERRGTSETGEASTTSPAADPVEEPASGPEGAKPDSKLRARVERALLRARQDRHGAAELDEKGGFCVKSFAGIYRLIAIFDGPTSSLAVESVLRRALPVIERVVSSLPPRDPEPSDRNVLSLHKK